MDRSLFDAISRNNKSSFLELVQENKIRLQARVAQSQDTVLHLASRFGHTELVSEIIKLCPDMVAARNSKGETPLHEACHKGNADVIVLLLETNPWVASTVNCENQSPFFIACSKGYLDVVKVISNESWLMEFEEDRTDLNSLHVSIVKGHTNIVKTILKARPSFARKIDEDGFSPLHYACYGGRFEITRMLLDHEPDLALQFNKIGYAPLHLAATNGTVMILIEFLSRAPKSFQLLTREGETVFHLAIRSSNHDAFTTLANIFKNSNILRWPDQNGNTVLHVAISTGCYSLADYIINKTAVDINYRNLKGHTAFDLLDQARSTPETEHTKDMLKKFGGKKSIELSSPAPEVDTMNPQNLTLKRPRVVLEQGLEMHSGNENQLLVDNNQPTINVGNNCGADTLSQVEEKPDIQDDKLSKPESPMKTKSSPTNLRRHKHLSQKRRKELSELLKNRRTRQNEIYREALQNARNSISLMSILIVSVTFTAGVSPPGGVYQEGHLKGQSTVGRTTAFKVFVISNNIAFFTSLCTVLVLVSIISFRRKQLMKLMVITHKVMWVAVLFMAIAYIAATWVVVPHGQSTGRMLGALMVISAGTMGTVYAYLGVMLVRHWWRKLKWREEKGRKKVTVADTEEKIQSKSTKPDVEEVLQSQSTTAVVEGEIQSQCTKPVMEGEIQFQFTRPVIENISLQSTKPVVQGQSTRPVVEGEIHSQSTKRFVPGQPTRPVVEGGIELQSIGPVIQGVFQSHYTEPIVKDEIWSKPFEIITESESDSESTNSDLDSCSSSGFHAY